MVKISEYINKYNQIVIYRHVNPDLDAFGSQFGLYLTLKAIYPNKNIDIRGEMTSDLMRFYPSVSSCVLTEEPILGIVLDTANHERIDGDTSVCKEVIKIDHHIVVDSFGDINIEIPTASSTCEVMTLLLKDEKIDIPYEAANAFYLGIIGDSNRFLYSSTSTKTFEAASYLLESGIDIEKLYQSLYLKKKAELQVTKFIYNTYQEYGSIAYYYLSAESLKEIGITREQGSNYVNTLSNIDEYKVWMAITENVQEHNYRVSIRSRGVPINEVASEFRGGGHMYASGATLLSLDELDDLLNKLKEKING
ncbi:MAG: bifunctional oligoribonuclease/PAP phosphatase NrnA [Coprobacillus sp.]